MWRSTLISGLVFGVKITLALALNKVLAFGLGPQGFAIYGQLSNFLSVGQALGGSATTNGILRASSTRQALSAWLLGALLIALPGTLALCLWLLAGGPSFGLPALPWPWYILLWPALVSLLSIQWLLALLQGRQLLRQWSMFSLLSSAVSLLGIGAGLWWFGLSGVFWAALLCPLALALASLPLLLKLARPLEDDTPCTLSTTLRPLSRFALSGGILLIVGPSVSIALRQRLIESHSLDTAGLWQGMSKLSEMGMMVASGLFGFWLLPRLARLESNKLWPLIIKTSVWITLCSSLAVVIAWMFKRTFISLLLDASYVGIAPYWHWQLAGDVLRVLGWIAGSALLVRGCTWRYPALELCFQGVYLTLGWWLGHILGVEGMAKAYFWESLLYVPATWLMLEHLRRHEIRSGGSF